MEDGKRRLQEVIGVTLAGLLATAFVACEQRQPAGEAKTGEAKQETPVVTTSPAAAEAQQPMPDGGVYVALTAPESSPGRAANDEGVNHAQQGHWDVAESHFRKALEADAKLAEAQFNLGLALDKLGKHEDATAAFKKAAELAPSNVKITESPVLKKHTST